MSYTKRNLTLPLAISIAFLAVTIFGIVTFHNTDVVRENERQIAHSFRIRETTRELLSSMKDMETGQRGFLITGSERYLDSYYLGLTEVDQAFDRLRELTNGRATQQANIDQLEKLNNDRKAYLTETIELRRKANGPTVSENILALMSSGRGKETMDATRQIVANILTEQKHLLARQESVADESAWSSRLLIVAGNVLSLGLLLTAGVVAHLDRKQRDNAEQQMRAKQSELEAIINSSHDGVVTFGRDLRVRLMNPAAAAIFRVAAESVVGKSVLALCPSTTTCDGGKALHDFLSSSMQVATFTEAKGKRTDGQEFPFTGVMTKTVADDEFVTWMIHDLSESKANQVKIREQAAILDRVRDAILVCDMQGRILYWNGGSQRLFGYAPEDAVDRNVGELLFTDTPDFWEQGQIALLEKDEYSTEVTHRKDDGTMMTLEHRRSLIRDEHDMPSAQMVLNIDVSERKKDELRDRRSQRLISIGTLSGGIAHDLNNVLTPILMSAKLIKRAGSDHQRLADTIVTSAARGGQMIKKLLAFAGGEDGPREKINFADILAEAEAILRHTLPKTIKLRVEHSDDLPLILGNATELSQIVMNLSINARDAMPDGGRLDLVAERFYVDPSRASRSDILTVGPHVLLKVCDTGEGIDKDIITQIFDPFFTTKEQGKGTGLGLATSLGIIRSHGGDIDVYSELGVGTTFSVYLPCVSSRVQPKATQRTFDVPEGHSESILLIDDEPLILDTVAETLRAHGYRVQTASSGDAAVEIYRGSGQPFD
ncbi:MAG: CHASE3 domain-containing protein, partial [Planctomycetales bacterium]|nr:CHASE3 domain-containing protein [Planctomycetales bacterium]